MGQLVPLDAERAPEGMRARILQCAARAFAEFGYGGSSLRLIGRDAGVTAAALYHHFTNKEDLLRSIVVDATTRLTDILLAKLAGGDDPVVRLEAMVRAHMDFELENQADATVILEQAHLLDEVGFAVVREKQLAILNLYRACIRDVFQRRGATHNNVTVMAFNVICVINGLPRWFRGGHSLSRQAVLDQAMAFVMGGVLSEPPT
jgi:AcrR family transcriptional regulator